MRSSVELVKSLSAARVPGPKPTFTPADILLALLVISEGRVGRAGLSKRLGLGEGAVRSLLKRLRKEGLVTVTRGGCALTKRGEGVVAGVREVMPFLRYIGRSPLAVGGVSFAVLVRGAARKVKSGLEQRDEAVRAGASGATVVTCVNGELLVPGCPPEVLTSNSLSGEVERLARLLEPKSGDVIIVGSGPDERSAARGALAAALSLLDC